MMARKKDIRRPVNRRRAVAAWAAAGVLAGGAGFARAGLISGIIPSHPFGGSRVYWSDYFGIGSLANDDVHVNDDGDDDSLTPVYLRADHQVGTLTIDPGGHIALYSENENNPYAMVIVHGQLTVQSPGSGDFYIPVFFKTDATVEANGLLSFEDIVAVNDGTNYKGITVQGGNNGKVFFNSALVASSLTIKSSEVKLNDLTSYQMPILIGDGLELRGGNGSAFLSEFTGAGTPSAALTIRSDGSWFPNHDFNVRSLDLQGGKISLFSPDHGVGPQLMLPAKITASSASFTDQLGFTTVQDALISVLQGAFFPNEVDGKLNLGGRQTEFNVTSNDGPQYGLRVETPLVNGSLLKTGNGTLTLAGRLSSTFGTTTVDEGILALEASNGATALPGDVTVGRSASIATLMSNADNQIFDGAYVTVQFGSVWNLQDHSETIRGLTLIGGQVTGSSDGVLGLIEGIAGAGVDGQPVPSIAPAINLNGYTATFLAGHLSGSGIDLSITGPISNGAIVKTEGGTLRLGGSQANTASMTVAAGTLELDKSAMINAVADDLIVGTADQTSGGPTVRWLGNQLFEDQVNDAITVKMCSGTLDLNGHIEYINGINASGGGAMNILTGDGTRDAANGGGSLVVKGTSTAFVGAHLDFDGNLDLDGGGVRTFDARGGANGVADFTNFTFTGGRIDSGTFRKTGVGTVLLDNIGGTAILQIDAGIVRTTTSTLAGLQGAGGVFDIGTSTEINDSAGTRTFSGVLSGNGSLTKTGPGTLVLAGIASNTLAGKTTVSGGTLALSKTNSASALAGALEIRDDATVDVNADVQLSSTHDVIMSGGTLALHRYDQVVQDLTMTGGSITGDSQDFAFLFALGDVRATSATIDHISLYTNDFILLGSSVANIRGGVSGNSSIGEGAKLIVENTNSSASELTFYDGLKLADQNSTLALILGQPSDHALIDVQGGLLIGSIVIDTDAFPIIVSMSGTAAIDLSGNTSLAAGVYNLIDFSDSAGLTVYPQVENFNLIAPQQGTQGNLVITNNVLQYVVPVPEPAALVWLAGALLAFAHPRRRRPGGFQ